MFKLTVASVIEKLVFHFVVRFKAFFGAVKQHPQIAAVHVKLFADLVFIAFIQHRPQDGFVTSGELVQHLAHDVDALLLQQVLLQVGVRIDYIDGIGIKMLVAVAVAIVLHPDVVADGVHKSAEAVRLPDFSSANCGDHARKSFLLDIFYSASRRASAAQFDAQ